ncbi:MAG: hypothetical protein KC476_07005 [Cyanobacteria bacterium HKST-UBA06]|nr:hypothetical protein [Cyanobacteria bacterium HKST-UBA04]MCA9807688.1 hypothetical protein [Cyanobacteria bacterium HKST-UBA06]
MPLSIATLLSNPAVRQASYLVNTDKSFKAVGVEVLGINLPRILLTRTTREKMDVAVCELGNTVGFFGLLWGGGALVDKLLKHNGLNVINQPGVLSRGRVAKSLLLIPPLFAFMAAMPFIRNAYTAYSSGTTNFKNLITRQGQSPNRNPTSFASAFLHPAEVANQKERGEVMAKVRHDLMLGRDIFLVGTALGLLGFGLASGSMGRFSLFSGSSNRLNPVFKSWGVDRSLKKMLNGACFRGSHANEMTDAHALAYWGLPCYAALIAASRDAFEVKEQLLKMINFNVMFMMPGLIVGGLPYFKNQSVGWAKKLPGFYSPEGQFNWKAWKASTGKGTELSAGLLKKAVAFETRKTLAQFAATTVLMSVFPALLNIWLTRQRLKKYHQTVQSEGFEPYEPLRRGVGSPKY